MQWARGNQGHNFQIFISIRSWEEQHLINYLALWVLSSASQGIWYTAAKRGPALEVPNNFTLVTTRKTRRSADMRARLLTLHGKAGVPPGFDEHLSAKILCFRISSPSFYCIQVNHSNPFRMYFLIAYLFIVDQWLCLILLSMTLFVCLFAYSAICRIYQWVDKWDWENKLPLKLPRLFLLPDESQIGDGANFFKGQPYYRVLETVGRYGKSFDL